MGSPIDNRGGGMGITPGPAPVAKPNTQQAVQDLFGVLSQASLSSITAPGAKLGESTVKGFQTRDSIDASIGINETTHQTPPGPKPGAIENVLNPDVLEGIGVHLSQLQQINQNLSIDQSQIEALGTEYRKKPDAALMQANQLIPPPGGPAAGALMFSEAAIQLAVVFSQIAQMNKLQAYVYSQNTINTIIGMIENAKAQAALQIEKGNTEAFAAFMSAGLAAVGALVSIRGASKAFGLDSAQSQATTMLYSGIAEMFNKVGTGIVEGFKSKSVGEIEAKLTILQNASQILAQMASKWSDAAKESNDSIAQLMQMQADLLQKLLSTYR